MLYLLLLYNGANNQDVAYKHIPPAHLPIQLRRIVFAAVKAAHEVDSGQHVVPPLLRRAALLCRDAERCRLLRLRQCAPAGHRPQEGLPHLWDLRHCMHALRIFPRCILALANDSVSIHSASTVHRWLWILHKLLKHYQLLTLARTFKGGALRQV